MDEYYPEDDSSSSSSSEDEFDFGFGLLGPRFRKQRDMDAADFELEMDRELESIIQRQERGVTQGGNPAVTNGERPTTSQRAAAAAPTEKEKPSQSQYDSIYFDSDEEEQDERKTKVLSNDELLYDPNMDDSNEAWVAAQQPQQSKQSGKRTQRKSQTVLNCPACLTVLCRDCQRHETYHNQYRAMFTFNCRVDESLTLKCPLTAKGRKQLSRWEQKKKLNAPGSSHAQPAPEQQEQSLQPSDEDVYHPVHCQICNTEVAVYDKDEIFHFFHVLESYG